MGAYHLGKQILKACGQERAGKEQQLASGLPQESVRLRSLSESSSHSAGVYSGLPGDRGRGGAEERPDLVFRKHQACSGAMGSSRPFANIQELCPSTLPTPSCLYHSPPCSGCKSRARHSGGHGDRGQMAEASITTKAGAHRPAPCKVLSSLSRLCRKQRLRSETPRPELGPQRTKCLLTGLDGPGHALARAALSS